MKSTVIVLGIVAALCLAAPAAGKPFKAIAKPIWGPEFITQPGADAVTYLGDYVVLAIVDMNPNAKPTPYRVCRKGSKTVCAKRTMRDGGSVFIVRVLPSWASPAQRLVFTWHVGGRKVATQRVRCWEC